MISAESGTSFVERAYELGVSDYISRPFDALIVRRRVVNTLMLYAKQKLMPEEFEVMKNHATVGAAMLKALGPKHSEFVSPSLLNQVLPIGVIQNEQQRKIVNKRSEPIR